LVGGSLFHGGDVGDDYEAAAGDACATNTGNGSL
jgi:hypothetical protein